MGHLKNFSLSFLLIFLKLKFYKPSQLGNKKFVSYPIVAKKVAGKMKTKWEGHFFLRMQFDVVFDSESNGGIFDSLALFGGEL